MKTMLFPGQWFAYDDPHNPYMIVRLTFHALIYCAMGSFFCLLAAAMPEQTPVDPATVAVLDDARMRIICLAGALGGSMLSVMLWPPTNSITTVSAAIRGVIGKMFISSLAGFIFSPLIIRHFDKTKDTDWVLAISAVSALTSVAIIKLTVPLMVGYVRGLLRKWAGVDDRPKGLLAPDDPK